MSRYIPNIKAPGLMEVVSDKIFFMMFSLYNKPL